MISKKKRSIVGVSVTPDVGLEIAEIDFASQTVLKYGTRQLEYDGNKCEIADLDLFKEALQDLLLELDIPKGTEIVLNLPAPVFKVVDYPTALDGPQVMSAIEEELAEHFIFKSVEPTISAVRLPNSTIQFNKIAYTVVQKAMLIEIIMFIKELGYKIYAAATSVNSVLNALMYKQRVEASDDTTWVLLIVERTCCRILSMNGRNYVDTYEERISIGEVLGDAENYGTVVSAVAPTLKNIPSKYLCVVSKTNVISAEVLASKLTYAAPIIHQEANCFSKEALMQFVPGIDENIAKTLSLDIIGTAIYRDFEPYSHAPLNLFNESLGEIYTIEQPPKLTINGTTYELTNAFLTKLFITITLFVLVPSIAFFIYFTGQIGKSQVKQKELEARSAKTAQFLKENEDISAELFDEGDEIRIGIEHNKRIYSYYTVVGTEIPKKLWLTHLNLGEHTTIEGQADNLESVYAFFRSIKDFVPSSNVKLQKLGLASKTELPPLSNKDGMEFDTNSILTTLNADFYEFLISDVAPPQNTQNLTPIK